MDMSLDLAPAPVAAFINHAPAIVDAVERWLVQQVTGRGNSAGPGDAAAVTSHDAPPHAPIQNAGQIVAAALQHTAHADGTDLNDAVSCAWIAQCALYAIAARYLAVGTPRSLGVIVPMAIRGETVHELSAPAFSHDLAALQLAALRVFFPSGEVRIAVHAAGAVPPQHTGAVADTCGAAATHIATSLAGTATRPASSADLVCYLAAVPTSHAFAPRRGQHVNVATRTIARDSVTGAITWSPLTLPVLDASWLCATATVTGSVGAQRVTTTLPRLAAGLDDGRQLDEVSVFVYDC